MKVTRPTTGSPAWPWPPASPSRLHELRRGRRGRGRRRPDHHRHLPPAHRRLLRARQGRAARLRGLGRLRQRERRPAGPRRRADDPRRPVQRRPGRLRLREADQPGRRRPRLRPLLHPAGGPRRPGRRGLRLPLRRAGRRRRGGLRPRASTTSSTPPPPSPTTTTTTSPTHIEALPEAERPKTAAYAAMDDPFAHGHRLRPARPARGDGRRDRRRRGLPAQHHRLRLDRGQDRRQQGRRRRRRHAVPGRRQPDRGAAAARLPAEDGRLLDRADQPRVPRGDRRRDRGHPLPHRLHARGGLPHQRGVRRVLHRDATAPRPAEDEANALDHRPGRRRRRRGRRLRRPGPRVPAAAHRLAARERGRHRRRPADLGRRRAGREGAHLIQQYVDGEIRIVLPEDAAEADLILEKPAW